MLAAPSFDQILRRAPAWGTPENPTGERLISIIFANPSSDVWRDVHTNRAFLDARSGEKWDLFFAGMSGFARMEQRAKQLWDPFWRQGWPRFLNPTAFEEIEKIVSRSHAQALKNDGRDSVPWRYSGKTDLVSFLCHARQPDWLTLVHCRVDGQAHTPYTLGEVTEGLRNWKEDLVVHHLMPGEFERERLLPTLAVALQWSAAAIGSGVLGNYVYDMLKLLTCD